MYGEDDLTMDVVINESGTINYPFLGEIRVAGLTTVELDQRIVRGLQGRLSGQSRHYRLYR